MYCMGAVAWLVLLGATHRPLQDDHTDSGGARADHANDALQLVPGVPERAARVLCQCTSDNPAKRPSARLVQLQLEPGTISESRASSSPTTVPPSHCSERGVTMTRTPSDAALRFTKGAGSPGASMYHRGWRRPPHRRMSLFLQAVGHEQVESQMAASGATLEMLEKVATNEGATALWSFLHDTCGIHKEGVILDIVFGLVASGIQLKPSP